MITRRTREEYEAAVSYITDTPKFMTGRNKSGNENLSKVLDVLGNPHRSIKCVHVAGTNGKGSTVQMIKCLLAEQGFTVGVFTSPHLIRINERIMLCRQTEEGLAEGMISDEDFVNAFDLVKKAVEEVENNGGFPLSYFEFLFALAAVYFDKLCEERPDYVIWETGLGGRLDATNLVSPEVCVITQIGLDHMKYLGDTVEQIAAEKAGILKQGVPVVFRTGDEKADAVIGERARELGCPLIEGARVRIGITDQDEKGIDFSFASRYYNYGNLRIPNQAATYQADNAVCALLAANRLCKTENGMPEDAVNHAFSRFSFPGRMERAGAHVVLDGAHNPAAIGRFCEAVKTCYAGRGVRLLFAVACDKDYDTMINMLTSELEIKCCYVTALASDRALSPDYVGALFRAKGVQVYESENIGDCLEKGYGDALRSDDILFCVGSLYLIGSVKELIGNDKF